MVTFSVVVASQVFEGEKQMFESIFLCPRKQYCVPSNDKSCREYEITIPSAFVPGCEKNLTFPSITLRVALDKAKQDTVPVHSPSYVGPEALWTC